MTKVCKVKCLDCGLHFAAYSWEEDWKPVFCPESGEMKRFLVYEENSDKQVFEFVPGTTGLAGVRV